MLRARVKIIEEWHTEDVVVSEHGCLVELRFAEPACLLRGEEDLDGDILVPPLPLPYLSVSTLSDASDQVDLLSNRSLNLLVPHKNTTRLKMQVLHKNTKRSHAWMFAGCMYIGEESYKLLT